METIKEEDFPTLDGLLYLSCEFCEHWNDGDGPCARKFKPTLYAVDGCKNTEMHYRKQCFYKNGKPKNWIKAETELHFRNDGLFDCNASQCH